MILATCRVYIRDTDILYTEETICFENAKELKNYLLESDKEIIVDKVFELSDDKTETCKGYVEWHPYPDENPPKDDYYLITVKGNGCLHTYYACYEECKTEGHNGFFPVYDNECVVAWAELPKPYKGDSDGQ